MLLVLSAVCAAVLGLLIFVWMRHVRENRELEQHTITPEALHALLASHQEIPVFDVRLPLDLLTDLEIIPGAKRISPEDLLNNPSLIPREKVAVIYLTTPEKKKAREIVRHALAMKFCDIKFLKGGLDAWKAKGYPVEPYRDAFHLYTPNLNQFSDRHP